MASSVAAPLERQFGQIAGVTQMTSTSTLGATSITHAIRSQPQYRCGRAGRAGRDHRGRPAIADKPAVPADLPQGQSGRFADPDPGGAFRLAAAHGGRRLCRQRPRAADLADLRASPRSSIGGEQKPAIRVQVDPAKLAAQRAHARGRARRSSSAPPPTPPRARSTAAKASFTIAANDQLTKASAVSTTSIIAYRNGAPIRVRDVGHAVDEAAENATSPPGRTTQRGHSADRSSSSPAPTSSTPSTRSRRSCRASPPSSRRRSRSTPFSDRTSTIRASVARRGVHARAHHRPRRDGDPAVPAQLAGRP